MTEAKQAPLMFQFLFGETAEAAQQGASQRLKRWCAAFDEWLAERRGNFERSTHKQSMLAWRRLLRQQRKTPWELAPADLAQHAAWMQAQEYSPATISNSIGIFQNFYRWCGEHEVDQACGAAFNPAAGVPRPKIVPYAGAKMLSLGEAQALLDLLRRDSSPLGERDFAFFLARLRTGVPLRLLQRLQWGQIEPDEGGAWVRWRPEAERQRLPGEVWQAIQASLAASGRLAAMQTGKFLFVPLADPLHEQPQDRPEAWDEGQCLSRSRILANLKLYGRLAGIPDEKLTLMALRRTATRLMLDEHASQEKVMSFLDTREKSKAINYRLRRLPSLPHNGVPSGQQPGPEPSLPDRKPVRFQPGDGITHGFYARSQPLEAVAAVLAENIQGLEEEIVRLRTLARGLLEWQEQAGNRQEAARLGDAYTLAVSRLAEMIRFEEQFADGEKRDSEAEEVLAMLDRWAAEEGWAPLGEAARTEALGSRLELAASDRRLVEEIATIRYLLRKIFAMASQAQEPGEYTHLTDLYSKECVRLVRLLRMEGTNQGKLTAYLKEQIDQAIDEVVKELDVRI